MHLKVDLDKELAEKFEKIQKEHGLKSKTETARFCINREYKRLFGKKTE